MEVKAKGFIRPVTLYEAWGIGRRQKFFCPRRVEPVVSLAEEVPFRYEIVEANYLGGESYKGILTKRPPRGQKYVWKNQFPILTNLKMQFVGTGGQDIPGSFVRQGPRRGSGE